MNQLSSNEMFTTIGRQTVLAREEREKAVRFNAS